MSAANGRLHFLLKQYTNGLSTESEERELFEIIDSTGNEEIEIMMEEILNEQEPAFDQERTDKILNRIVQELVIHPAPNEQDFDEYKVRKIFTWPRIAAAASILLILSVGGYFMFKNKENQDIVKTEPQEKRFKNDIAPPTKQRATITLADGSSVALDSVGFGKLATQGNVNVMMTADGKLVYKEQGASTPLRMQYNTLSNPRGSKVVDMTMTDGSRVWLNAGSSVTYPVAFVGTERKVSITGEAYFEVTHNAAMPFKVNKGEMEVTDLGTSFNVNAFDDEADIKVTLLEGAVKVVKGSSSGLLKPGQQAQIALRSFGSAQDKLAQGDIKVVNGINIDKVMAWKNGFFDCNGLNVESIMREVSRWYDVEISFKGSITQDKFVGRIPRTASLISVLKVLELNGIRFVIDGRKITVM